MNNLAVRTEGVHITVLGPRVDCCLYVYMSGPHILYLIKKAWDGIPIDSIQTLV